MGDIGRALADLNEAIRLDPQSADALKHRGLAYESQGDYAQAVPDFEAASRLTPEDSVIWNSRCWSKAVLGEQLQQALADCNESLRLAPNAPDNMDSRGFVYLKLGEIDKALADYDAALRLMPTLASSLYGRGLAKKRKGDTAGANSDFKAATALRPTIADEFAIYGVK